MAEGNASSNTSEGQGAHLEIDILGAVPNISDTFLIMPIRAQGPNVPALKKALGVWENSPIIRQGDETYNLLAKALHNNEKLINSYLQVFGNDLDVTGTNLVKGKLDALKNPTEIVSTKNKPEKVEQSNEESYVPVPSVDSLIPEETSEDAQLALGAANLKALQARNAAQLASVAVIKALQKKLPEELPKHNPLGITLDADVTPTQSGTLDSKTIEAISIYLGTPFTGEPGHLSATSERAFIKAALKAAENLAGQLHTKDHKQASAEEIAAIALTLMDKAVNPDDRAGSSTLHEVVAEYQAHLPKLRSDAGIAGK